MELKEFIDNIYGEFDYSHFSIETILLEISADILKYEAGLKSQKPKDQWPYYSQDRLDRLKEKYRKIEQYKGLDKQKFYGSEEEGKFIVDKVNAVTTILIEHYDIGIKEVPFGIELTGGASMHNSVEDVDPILKTILVYLDFYYPMIKKQCRVIEDQA
jgi:hypothetical protein